MTVFDNDLLKRITSNTSEGIINLREENIGDGKLEALGAALQDNNTVWSIQLPGKYGNITYKGLKSFAEKIALRKELLVVEANNGSWNEAFRYIEDSKRLKKEVDKLDDFLPTKSLALEEAKLVKEAPVLEVAEKASVVEVVEAPVIEVVEETPMVEVVKEVGKAEEAEEDLVELESTKSVDSLSVDDSVNVVPESFNTSYQENLVTILPNDIKSVKIKPTGFFEKISNAFTTMKYTFASLFNHNTTKDCDSSKFYVTKDDMFQDEDTNALGCVNDIDSD